MVDKMYPEVKCKGRLDNIARKDLLKRITGLMIYKILHVCRNSFDSIIISGFLGLTVLAQYGNYYYVVSAAIIFVSIITSSVVAGIGNSIVSETIDKNYVDFKEFLFLLNWIAVFITMGMLTIFQPFIKLWVGKNNVMDNSIVILFCIYFYVLMLGNVSAVYRNAAGIWWEDKYRPIIEGFINLLLNILLVKLWGVQGVIIATIISIVLVNIPFSMYILFKVYFKKSIMPIMRLLLRYSFQTIFIGVIIYAVTTVRIDNYLLNIILRLLACLLITNMLLIFFNRRREEYLIVKTRVTKLIVKR